MGALPKRRISSHRRGRRRASRKLNRVHLIPCPNCGKPKRSHFVCPDCGHYGPATSEKAK